MSDEFEEKPQEKPGWREYVSLVRRRHWYFLLPLFLGWLIVWGGSWILPPVYRSATLILVEQPTVPQQYVLSNVTGDLQERLNSMTQQILSRTRLLHIMDKLGLYAEERKQSGPDALADRMRKDIQIELVRSPGRDQLTAFNIYYLSRDPHLAQEVLAEITDLFITGNLEARQQQSEDTTKFLESQLEEARRNLAEQEQRVRQFKDQYLGELPGQLQPNVQILSGLQGQLQGETEALNRARQQNSYFQSLLEQYRSVQSTLRSGTNAPVGLPAIDQELDRERTQLADLSSHYTDRHPDVRKLKEQIAKTEKTRQQIMAELATKSGKSKTEENTGTAAADDRDLEATPAMIEVESQLKANQLEVANRQRAIKDLEAEIKEYQARLNRTPVREQQLADITRDYDQSKLNYDSLLAKKNQSTLATNLEKRQQGEQFRILDPPSLPSKPYSPNRLLFSGIGLFVGLAFGVGAAKGAEKIDDRIYDEKELRKLLPVRVLADIPLLSTPEDEKIQRRNLQLRWLGAALLFAAMAAGTALSYLHG